MSDEQLRELERQFKTSGSVEDETALLHARVQAKALSPDELRLAAHLGSEAAAKVARTLDLAPARLWTGEGPFTELDRWAWSPVMKGLALLVRVAVAAARSVMNREPTGAAAREAAEDWVQCPCAEHVTRAESVLQEAQRTLVASCAVIVVVHQNPLIPREAVQIAVRRAARQVGEPQVRVAIFEDVVPWVLGYRDPVRVRVEARGQDLRNE